MINLILLIFTLLIPLENKTEKWFNFGEGINLTTFFIILLILLWVFSKVTQGLPVFQKNSLNTPVLVFMLIMYVSVWIAYFKFGISPFGWGLHAYKRFITTFILFFIIVNAVNNKKAMKPLLATMVLMIFVFTLYTLKIYREEYRWHYSNDMRFGIGGMQPNILGAFFAQYLPLLAAFVFINKNVKSRLIYLFLFLIGLPALMFTYSRGAYLSIIVALFIMAILGGKRVFFGTISVLLVAMLATGILFGKGRIIPASVTERFTSITEEDKSIEGRKNVWSVAGERIKASPFLGQGYASSRYILPRDTHNMYLDTAMEAGIPALLLLLWILFIAFRISYKLFRTTSDPFYKALALSTIGCLAAVFVGNFFGTRLNFFPANGYFAILLGMTVRAKIEEDKAKRKVLIKK